MKVCASKGTNELPLNSKTLRNRKKRNRKKLKKILSNNCNINSVSVLTKTSNSANVHKKSQDLESEIPVIKGGNLISSQLLKKGDLNSNLQTTDQKHDMDFEKRIPEASITESCIKKRNNGQNNIPLKIFASKAPNNDINCDKSVHKPAITVEERKKIRAHKRNLPVFKARTEIIQIVQREPSTIFIGDTACGKSTQIPQYILEGGLLKTKLVAVTQPRRVAAITIAERVSKEVGTTLGERVGYCVRFEDVTSPSTRIKYLTDGMLLRESISDPLLLCYNVIVLDEAHERSLHTDILFGIVKKAQSAREAQNKDKLKIVIMSATMNYNHFSKFFNDAPVYHLRGREYNITILNALKTQEDYVYSALVTVFKIHRENDNGDILVFCTGSEEIHSMVSEVSKAALELAKLGHPALLPYALYAALPSKQQKNVFIPAPEEYSSTIFLLETRYCGPRIRTADLKYRTKHPGEIVYVNVN